MGIFVQLLEKRCFEKMQVKVSIQILPVFGIESLATGVNFQPKFLKFGSYTLYALVYKIREGVSCEFLF